MEIHKGNYYRNNILATKESFELKKNFKDYAEEHLKEKKEAVEECINC